MKVGFIAIMGRPNVGKSTLLNALLSKKVSIVSHKAQTTRDNILGILNEQDTQMVFVDTPGIYMGPEALDKHMREQAFSSSEDAEAVLYLIDSSVDSLEKDIAILSSLKTESKVIIVLNKIDLISIEKGEEERKELREAFPNSTIIQATLKDNFGIKEIKNEVLPTLVEGEPFFPEGMITDKDPSYQAKEVIRQELLHFLKQEVPHQSAVRIDSINYENGGYKIKATIAVERDGHKAIVIGKGGEMIKKISMSARHELERMWHKHVTALNVEVVVLPNWRNDPKALLSFGYGDE